MKTLRSQRAAYRQAQHKRQAVMISCVVPVYNEGKHIKRFLDELKTLIASLVPLYEIIVINDGSQDDTATQLLTLKDPAIKVIHFARNFGKEQALTAGIAHAKGDAVLLIDSDFQHPFMLIKQFFKHWLAGYHMIYGQQHIRHEASWLKAKVVNSYYHLLNWMANITIPPHAGDFRLIDRSVIQALQQCHESDRFMKGLYAWVGFDTKGIPFNASPRQSGKSHFAFKRLLGLAINSLCSFSSMPLRFASLVGVIIATSVFIYGLVIFADALINQTTVPGYTTLILSILFLGGMQLIFIGILGEYIGRIFNEVKRRPAYIIESTQGMNENQ